MEAAIDLREFDTRRGRWRKEWRARPEVKARLSAWYAQNQRQRRETPDGWAKLALKNIRRGARRRGLDFNLTWRDLLPPDRCPVFGCELRLASNGPGRAGGGYKIHPHTATVDRFDNALGYVKGNVRIISHRANTLKKDATADELRALLAYMEGVL